MDADAPPAPSQASSHFALEPTSGAVLFEHETRRRRALAARGRLSTGSRELDDQVLLGGLERGCVVGLSAEDEDVGLVMALQVVARMLAESGGGSGGGGGGGGAMVVTTLGMGALLPVLRGVCAAQGVGVEGLERVRVARVFDIDGLWDVLGELDGMVGREEGEGEEEQEEQEDRDAQEQSLAQGREEDEDAEGQAARAREPSSSPLSDPPSSLPDDPPLLEAAESAAPARTPPGQRQEIQDSEDEDHFSSPLAPGDAAPGTSPMEVEPAAKEDASLVEPPKEDEKTTQPEPSSTGHRDHEDVPTAHQPPRKSRPPQPDIVLITHISTLISSLFHQRDKAAAHQTLQILSSHLRYLTRSPEHGGPLVIILNSTTSSSDANSTAAAAAAGDFVERPPHAPPPPPPGAPETANNNNNNNNHRPLDPTLRSIFNPAPAPAYGYETTHHHPRRNKPFFGLIFTQMLDLHLLCTRVPKTRADAEALHGGRARSVRYAWVVEVLLDEVGRTRSREQRWGAVEVRDRAKVVDAFAESKAAEEDLREVVVSAGFGGRRV